MKGNAWERSVRLGEYIAESKDTVRKAATKFGISKSTVHTGVTKWNGSRDDMKNAMSSHKNHLRTIEPLKRTMTKRTSYGIATP